ncbi:MAG TPA: FtsK/SpoIIIE domain-containing protein, partial [Cryptosporangiaceae bacterium]|nr:FtsK/SpoIIIE domain-containing protein [Cryptosporangiaceae bacterium]
GNLTVVADGALDNTWPFDTLHGVLLRAFAAVPAGRLQVVVFDPRIRGVASPFASLRKYGNDLLDDPLATAGELTDRLVQLRATVTRVAEMAGAHGVDSLGALTEVTNVQPEPYRLLVVCDYPYGVDAAAQGELLRLAEGGPRRGVSLLVHHDPSVKPGRQVDPAALLAHSTVLRGTNAAARVNVLPDVTVRPDPGPPRALVDTVARQVAEAAWRGAAPTVDFEGLIPDAEHLWTQDAVHGMTARIGRAGLETVSIELRGSDPALPNVLIGGASGQGKSNLLLVMLHSIAASVPPEEVAMYLLDYKDGLEFDRLGPRPGKPWSLPHARVLGLEGDRPFGLSVLRHLDAEFRSRAEAMRAAGHSNLVSYRTAFPDKVLPRLLLVIDEFQMLVAEDDAVGRECIAILETLARRGRAVGVHLVLASQTLSGIETLKTKEGSIFGQFPWRLSLKTDANESEAVLGPGNIEAARLRFRGEVVLNSEYGDPEHNRRAVVAYADERFLDDLREHLWKKAGGPRPPRVFYAARPSDPADLPRALTRVLATAPATDETRYALLGLPVDVDPVPVSFGLSADPGRTFAILGEGRADAFGLFGSMAWSLATQDTPGGAEFVVLDAAGGEAGSVEIDQLVAAARSRDQPVTVHTGPAVPGALLELGALVDARLAERALGLAGQRPVYVLGVGLHRAARLTRSGDNGVAPVEGLRKLVRDGALVDVYLIGWWNSLQVFGEHLSDKLTPLVGGYAFLRAPESEVQAVLGASVRYTPQPHRVLYCDVGHGGSPTPVVPFGLPPEGGR